MEKILKYMINDKKNNDSKISLILLRKIGKTTKPGKYKYNPKRPPAAPIYNDQIKKEVNENAKNENKKLYRNLGDNILYENSMHNFYTMPNTKIPNNQKDFALFCYGNMPSCKEGDSLQCTKNNAGLRRS